MFVEHDLLMSGYSVAANAAKLYTYPYERTGRDRHGLVPCIRGEVNCTIIFVRKQNGSLIRRS